MSLSKLKKRTAFAAAAVAPVGALWLLSMAWAIGTQDQAGAPHRPPTERARAERADTPTVVASRHISVDAASQMVTDIAVAEGLLLSVSPTSVVGAKVYDLDSGAHADVSRQLARGTALPRQHVVWTWDDAFVLGSASNPDLTVLRPTASEGARFGVSRLERGTGYDKSLRMRSGLWLSNHVNSEAILTVSERQMDVLVPTGSAGSVPFPAVSEPNVNRVLNRNMIAVSPDGSRAVQAYMYSCRLEVYDARLNHERSVAAPFDVRLSYHVRDNAATGLALFKHLPDTKLCYIDVEATGNGFIGLFAGRDVGDMPRHEADQLHVYSWDGRLIQLVRTEEPLQSIAAVPNGSAIWAFVPGANPRFAKYDLKWH